MTGWLLFIGVWFAFACAFSLWLGPRIDAHDQPTHCTNPLSHPLDACARRNGGQL